MRKSLYINFDRRLSNDSDISYRGYVIIKIDRKNSIKYDTENSCMHYAYIFRIYGLIYSKINIMIITS